MAIATETKKKAVRSNGKLASEKSKIKRPVDDYAQRVEKKAYELYLQRDCQDGNDLGDWYEAERLVEADIIAGK